MVDLKKFTLKNKPITYTGIFIELYNKRNREHVYEMYRIIELEKLYALTAKNLCDFSTMKQSLEIKTSLCFMSIIIFIRIKLTNYMIQIRQRKIYKMQILLLISLDLLQQKQLIKG